MKATSLSTSFFAQLAQKRLFTTHIAELATALAGQAGESVTRPLSKAQLERALQVNYAESQIVMDLLLDWAGEQRARGEISEDDVYFD